MNGIHATLYGYPALLNQHPLKAIKSFYGISKVLIANGYSTMYYTTHDDLFDNVAGYIIANGIEHVYSQNNYPKNEIRSGLGVSDDFMLKYVVNKISEYHKNNDKPLFAAILKWFDNTLFVLLGDHGTPA